MKEINPIFGFMGGSAEFIPAGEVDITDEQGNSKHLVWKNHFKITVGRRTTKLNKSEMIAIAQLMKENKDFRDLVEKCP